MLPLVSVIVPSYNHERFIQEALLSVVNQDYQNIELIIIDDGSTDNSIEKINELIPILQNRFKRFDMRSRPNKGLLPTLNEALEWCEGQFISPLASDDGWDPRKISTQLEFLLSNPEIPACCTNVAAKDDRGAKSFYTKDTLTFYNLNDILLFRYHLPASTFMLNRYKIDFFPIYSEKYYSEDFYLFLKITASGRQIACLPQTLGFYRRHDNNTSSLYFKKLGEDRIKILNDYSEEELWQNSVSISLLIQATQTLSIKKLEGIKLIVLAIKINPKTLFTMRFIRFLIYFFMPKKYVRVSLGFKKKTY